MRLYLDYIPKWYQLLMSKYHWSLKTSKQDKVVYHTFDDGPIPGVTPWVLQQLEDYQAQATFFAIGDNARKNPAILEAILQKGHQLGNHTYNHLKGWEHSNEDYLANALLCENHFKSTLFRPPYGRIKKKQARLLNQAHYQIIMWDVLSGDWDANRSAEDCFRSIRKHAKPGSIIVFHDSIKSWPRLKTLLPQTLEYLQNAGYRFEAIKLQNTPTAE